MKTVAIIDHIGRLVIGQVLGESDTTLTLHNPVLVDARPDQNQQLQVTSFPVMFFEFLNKEHRDSNNWTYSKANIVLSDVVLDDRILSQYLTINTPKAEPVVKANPKVISINDL